jgi:pyruvate dehydrogenase E2 component (dihydrolipoamide acetyltransferase)
MNTVVMPKLSDMMTEGKILSWNKQAGDVVKKGEPLAEVETEKVNIEIESFFSGTLLKIIAPAGTSVPVGDPIALIGAPEELEKAQSGASQPAQAAPVTTQAAPANGRATTTSSAQAQPVQAQPVAPAQPVGATSSAATGGTSSRIKASPLARRLAEEHNLDINQIVGTGPDGRVIKDDIEAAIAAATATQPQPAQTQPAAATAAPAGASTSVVSTEDVEIVPLSNMRRTIARRLQESMQAMPHFYVTMAMDATQLVELRQQLNQALDAQGQPLRISYNDLVVLAVARALKMHPEINVTFDNDRILRHKSVHIGVAVALQEGLIAPVVRDADKRSITDLAREIRRLADAARSNKLPPQEFSGNTFTISNLGMLDVESFTAIINPPAAAILAVGAITPTPAVWEGQVVVRQQIKMTLSSDHRAIDGAQAAYFMRDLKHLVETPATLLL